MLGVGAFGGEYRVKKLEQRCLLTRRPLEGDQRVILGTITDNGRRLLDRILPIHAQDLVHAMRGISTAEKRTIVALLRKMQMIKHLDTT